MKVKKNTLVVLAYRMSVSDGGEIDIAPEDTPLEFVCGRGEVIPGFERELMGMEKGQEKTFTVAPDDAYGPRDQSLVKVIPKAGFPANLRLACGERFSFRSEQGAELLGEVCEIGDSTITADFNHPLAGLDLHFEGVVLAVGK